MTKQTTAYIVIEVKHHGVTEKIAQLIAQAAYTTDKVDDARVLTFGHAVLRPECVEVL